MSETNYIERYWRDAKPEDAIKEPPMVARFRMYGDVPWTMGELHGTHTKDGRIWFDKRFCNSWTICQVYDAPDPGEGWRLVDIEKDDYSQNGIEYWNSGEKAWLPRNPRNDKTTFLESGLYRIRITPTVTYVPFTWEDREQLRGKKVLAKEPHRQVEFTCDEFQLNDDGSFFVGEFYSVWLCKNAVFVDTGKPVGKELVQ